MRRKQAVIRTWWKHPCLLEPSNGIFYMMSWSTSSKRRICWLVFLSDSTFFLSFKVQCEVKEHTKSVVQPVKVFWPALVLKVSICWYSTRANIQNVDPVPSVCFKDQNTATNTPLRKFLKSLGGQQEFCTWRWKWPPINGFFGKEKSEEVTFVELKMYWMPMFGPSWHWNLDENLANPFRDPELYSFMRHRLILTSFWNNNLEAHCDILCENPQL